ncbi:MAG: methyltransferase domain-containing protein [Synechococcus sp.]|nr:methyltransferase domain-containing protein [Synechococcus sp.]
MPEQNTVPSYHVEDAVLSRYQAGAQAHEPSLCCPTEYQDVHYLDVIPEEILTKDYGCGDPTRYAKPGDVVLDLGSGAGKNCYIVAQKVGPTGQVIGVDFNDVMLALARKYQGEIAAKIGFQNTEFVKGKIQDLKLPLESLQIWLQANPITSVEDIARYEAEGDRLRATSPLIADESIDLVISNCVLNLVKPSDKRQLFQEIHRVLKKGGRAVISDIVCDESPTEKILKDPDLWSGCIAGAFLEAEFLQMFADAGFYGIEILSYAPEPWQTVDGIEFRSMTVRAYKGKEGVCLERNQAVIYKGPWQQIQDDDGHTYFRGERMAVCDKTFKILTNPDGPYAGQFIPVAPYTEISLEAATEFNCRINARRHPQETKGADYHLTRVSEDAACCSTDSCC